MDACASFRQEDYNAWLSGVYIAKAIEATICNAFRDKNSQKEQYPNRPLSFYEEGLEELEELDEQAKEEKEKKQKEQEILKAKLYMQNMVTAGKNWGKKR